MAELRKKKILIPPGKPAFCLGIGTYFDHESDEADGKIRVASTDEPYTRRNPDSLIGFDFGVGTAFFFGVRSWALWVLKTENRRPEGAAAGKKTGKK